MQQQVCLSTCRDSGAAHKDAGGDEATVTREVRDLMYAMRHAEMQHGKLVKHAAGLPRNAAQVTVSWYRYSTWAGDCPPQFLFLLQGREATREAVGSGLDASVDLAFRAAQRQAELREAKRAEALQQAAERRMTFQQRVRSP